MIRKIFISYTREDEEIARQAEELFFKSNYECFRDIKNLSVGDRWVSEKLARIIAKCDAICIIISDKSIESRWVAYEIGLARGMKLIEIPVRINKNLKLYDYFADYNCIEGIEALSLIAPKLNNHLPSDAHSGPMNVMLCMSETVRSAFFAEFSDAFNQIIHNSGYSVILKASKDSNNPSSQKSIFFPWALQHVNTLSGAFIIPIHPTRRKTEIVDFCHKFNRPIIFIDIRPFEERAEYPLNVAYVGYNSYECGRSAAQAAIHDLKIRKIYNPKFLVIASTIEPSRQKGFKELIKEVYPDASIIINDKGSFSREQAHQLARKHFDATNEDTFDCVFCTNDLMALGVRDYLASKENRSNKQVSIIGYDGIEEATSLINQGDQFLKNTVVQDTERLAEEAITLFLAIRDGVEHDKMFFLEPHLYSEIE